MKKRKHTDTSRLTSRERVASVCEQLSDAGVTKTSDCPIVHPIIQQALQAHARETLARHKLRAAKRGK